MQYGRWHDIVITGALTLFLVGAHYLFSLIKHIHWLKPNRITSFAGGSVVAYVFLYMLPGLVESRDRIYELLARTTLMNQSKDLIIFVAALVGFEVFYFIERLSLFGKTNTLTFKKRSYRIHLCLYFIYNFLITYALLLSVEASLFYTIIYVLTVALHFILTDNHFNRYFKDFFGPSTHVVLMLGLVCGFVVSIFLYPIQLYIAAIATAILSGAILYNSFTEEITLTRKTSIAWFFSGSLIVGALLSLHLTH